MALGGTAFHLIHRVTLAFQSGFNGFGGSLVFNVELADFLTIDGGQAGFEVFILGGRHGGFDGPIFLRAEGFDFQFAVADQTQRDRLHTPRRTRARQLAPENGREGEADEIIQCAAGQISLYQRCIDLAGVFHRFQNGRFGDGVENHALDGLALQHLLLIQNFQHMP